MSVEGSILIKGGRILDPKNKIDKTGDILVKDGKIAAVSDNIAEDAERVIDAKGMYVMPGLIDLHTTLPFR